MAPFDRKVIVTLDSFPAGETEMTTRCSATLNVEFVPRSVCEFPLVSWDANSKTLLADASDLGYRGEGQLRVTSRKTGVTETFFFKTEQHDREGELVCRSFSGPRGLRFDVYND